MTAATLRTPLAICSEALASYAAAALFVALFTAGEGRGPSLVAVAIVVALSFGLARLLQATDLDADALRMAGLAVSVGALVLILQFEYAADSWLWELGWLGDGIAHPGRTIEEHRSTVAGGAALGALWLRGIARGQQEIEFDDVLASGSLGIVAFGLAAATGPDSAWPGSFGALALWYGVLSLAVLALYRVPDADASIVAIAQRLTAPIAAVAGASAFIALAALAVDPDAFGILAPAGRVIGGVLISIVGYALTPFAIAIDYIFQGVGWLLRPLFGELQNFTPPEQQEPQRQPEESDSGRPAWQSVLLMIATATGGVMMLFVVLFLLWAAFKRYARRERGDARERRESVEAASSLGDDLRALFGAIRHLGRSHRAYPSGVEVRRLYYDMLEQAREGGLERPPPATPMQFIPALRAHFGSDTPWAITGAFIESRYGEHDVDAARVRALRDAWHRLRHPG